MTIKDTFKILLVRYFLKNKYKSVVKRQTKRQRPMEGLVSKLETLSIETEWEVNKKDGERSHHNFEMSDTV